MSRKSIIFSASIIFCGAVIAGVDHYLSDSPPKPVTHFELIDCARVHYSSVRDSFAIEIAPDSVARFKYLGADTSYTVFTYAWDDEPCVILVDALTLRETEVYLPKRDSLPPTARVPDPLVSDVPAGLDPFR